MARGRSTPRPKAFASANVLFSSALPTAAVHQPGLLADAVLIQDCQHVREQPAEPFERWNATVHAGDVDELLAEPRRERARPHGKAREKLQHELAYLEAGRSAWPLSRGDLQAFRQTTPSERTVPNGAAPTSPQVASLLVVVLNAEPEGFWKTKDTG